jgi:cell division protein FtsB
MTEHDYSTKRKNVYLVELRQYRTENENLKELNLELNARIKNLKHDLKCMKFFDIIFKTLLIIYIVNHFLQLLSIKQW